MRIVITGNGKSGSWKVRGEQLGRAIGADVIPNAMAKDLEGYDVCICVKRPTSAALNFGNSVFDVVDCWPQPMQRGNYFEYVKEKMRGFKYTIAATQKMEDDVLASWSLRHHYRPSIEENQIRKDVRVIGYEGAPHYITEWLPFILRECKSRGWKFDINPANIASCDAMIGVRGGQWRNYASDHWKSGVKFSNAIGSLTPFIALPECGYLEYGVRFERVDLFTDLAKSFDRIADHDYRLSLANEYKNKKTHYSIEAVAAEYLEWLKTRF
jgi:hypothetical protein